MLYNIFVLGLAAIAAAMPLEADIQERAAKVTYYQGTCSATTQVCTLKQSAGGKTAWPCDQQSGKCNKNAGVCTLSSTNIPGDNPYATGKAYCTT